MKIRKVVIISALAGILGLGPGFLLSGCSGVNNSLEKEHIMNGGCFITCYNKKTYGKTDTLNKAAETAAKAPFATAAAENAA